MFERLSYERKLYHVGNGSVPVAGYRIGNGFMIPCDAAMNYGPYTRYLCAMISGFPHGWSTRQALLRLRSNACVKRGGPVPHDLEVRAVHNAGKDVELVCGCFFETPIFFRPGWKLDCVCHRDPRSSKLDRWWTRFLAGRA